MNLPELIANSPKQAFGEFAMSSGRFNKPGPVWYFSAQGTWPLDADLAGVQRLISMREKFTYTPKLDPARSRKYEGQKYRKCWNFSVICTLTDEVWGRYSSFTFSYIAAASDSQKACKLTTMEIQTTNKCLRCTM